MKTEQIVMTKYKDTAGTSVYQNRDANNAVNTVYVNKGAFGEKMPEEIELTVKARSK